MIVYDNHIDVVQLHLGIVDKPNKMWPIRCKWIYKRSVWESKELQGTTSGSGFHLIKEGVDYKEAFSSV